MSFVNAVRLALARLLMPAQFEPVRIYSRSVRYVELRPGEYRRIS